MVKMNNIDVVIFYMFFIYIISKIDPLRLRRDDKND